MIARKATTTPLTARPEERIVVPRRSLAFARRIWFAVTVAAVICVHVAVLAFFLWRDSNQPPPLAQVAETPVEVVVEPPPPKPEAEQKQPPPPPAPTPPIEKPATSAPRAQNTETDDTQTDKETRAPKAAPTPAAAPPAVDKPVPDQPQPDKTADSKPDDAKPDKTEPKKAEPDKAAPAPSDVPKPPDDKEAEALDKLPAQPPEPPRRPPALVKPKPVARPKTAIEQLAGAADSPEFTFAKPQRKKPRNSGGTEDDRYLAEVFGMITQYHEMIQVPSGTEWLVAVAFQVDGHGNLISLQIQHSSGYPSIDNAAAMSVQRAAPFPPPPSGAVTGLVARLRSEPRAGMDEGR